jgi:hypothetical protein
VVSGADLETGDAEVDGCRHASPPFKELNRIPHQSPGS